MMRQLIFLQLFCVVSLGEVLGAARVTRESNDTVCGLLKRETSKTDAPEGYQLALNVTCNPYGGRRNYCTKLKNDIGHTCLKRWKTCLRSAFARVSYDLKKVVSEDQKEYSIIFVSAVKNITSLTDGYDESIEIIDRQFLTCLEEHAVKVLTECTGNLTREDEFLPCNTDYSQVTTTPSKSISILAGILASIFGGIALGVIIIFVVVTYTKVRPARPGDQYGLRLRTKGTQTPSPSGSIDECKPLLKDTRDNSQSTPQKETEVEVHPQPLPVVIAKPAQPNAQGLTPTPNDFGAGTLGGSHHVTILGKKHSSPAKGTSSTSCPQSSSSDDGQKKHHTDVARTHRPKKKKVNRYWSNDNLQFMIDTGSSNGTSDSQPTSMDSSKPSASSKDATSSDNEHIA